MKEVRQECELCKGEASVYCEADAAFLCWGCDTGVHSANFLVARHVRAVACAGCRSLAAQTISGAGFAPIRVLCDSCDPSVPSNTITSSSSSSCVSTAESASSAALTAVTLSPLRRRRRRTAIVAEVEAEITRWSRAIGVRNARRCARMAVRVLGVKGGSVAKVPFRVAMAAALWAAVRREEEGCSELESERAPRRLEACSGLRARVSLLADSHLAGAASQDRTAKEGWDECP